MGPLTRGGETFVCSAVRFRVQQGKYKMTSRSHTAFIIPPLARFISSSLSPLPTLKFHERPQHPNTRMCVYAMDRGNCDTAQRELEHISRSRSG